MVTINSFVDINAGPSEVFALVEDVATCVYLNPYAKVLGIAKETLGPIQVGTTFLFRLIIEGHLIEHRSLCTGFAPGKYMETLSDTDPQYRVRVSVDPTPHGARLTHEESFIMEPWDMPLPSVNGPLGWFTRLLYDGKSEIRQTPESLAADEAEVKVKLQPRLDRWLASIKRHLEKREAVFYA